MLDEYNDNLYLKLVKHLEIGLYEIERFIDESISSDSLNELEKLSDLYKEIFSESQLTLHIDFGITRIHKLVYFREVALDRGNSYYHLKLVIRSSELYRLDEIYDHIISRVLRFYKALFSKIDNTSANLNPKQKALYQNIVEKAKHEIQKLQKVNSVREEINSERRRLKTQYLEKIPFKHLFHITHVSNIPGILDFGILSHSLARGRNLMKRDISNPEINARRKRLENIFNYKIHDYAPLYINPKNPMMEARCKDLTLRNEIILVKVNPNILVNKEVLFTDGNAAEESSNFYNNLENFNKLDWTCLNDKFYFNHNDGRRVRCSEVLVLKKIPLPFIDQLVSFSESTFASLLKLFPNHSGIQLKVDKSYFS